MNIKPAKPTISIKVEIIGFIAVWYSIVVKRKTNKHFEVVPALWFIDCNVKGCLEMKAAHERLNDLPPLFLD